MDRAGSCGSTRSARSATSRRRRPRTSPRSSRRSARTSPPLSTHSLVACSPRALTPRWSIGALPTWPPSAGTPLSARWASPQPRAAAPRRPRRPDRPDRPGRRDQPGRRDTDVESLHRHGVEPVVLTGVGGFLMLEDPEQFNPSSSRRCLVRALSRPGPGGGSTTARRTASRDRRRPRARRAPGSRSGVEVLDLEPRMGVGVAVLRIEEGRSAGCAYRCRVAGSRGVPERATHRRSRAIPLRGTVALI